MLVICAKQQPKVKRFCGVICVTGISQITNFDGSIQSIVISLISTAPKRVSPSSLMVAGMTTRDGKCMIEIGLNFSRAKKSLFYDFGIIKCARNSIAFFKRSGLRWSNIVRRIPHLNPLPLQRERRLCLLPSRAYLKNRAAAFSGFRCTLSLSRET